MLEMGELIPARLHAALHHGNPPKAMLVASRSRRMWMMRVRMRRSMRVLAVMWRKRLRWCTATWDTRTASYAGATGPVKLIWSLTLEGESKGRVRVGE